MIDEDLSDNSNDLMMFVNFVLFLSSSGRWNMNFDYFKFL